MDQVEGKAVQDLHTPASTNSFDIHSFHQNCLSTRRQSGKVGHGSAMTETFVPGFGIAVRESVLGEDNAPRPLKSSCCL